MRGCKFGLCWSWAWATTDIDAFQLHHSLKELVDDIEYPFSARPIYRNLHGILMGLIHKTDKDPYHGPKLRNSLEQWALNGRCVYFYFFGVTISHWANARMRYGDCQGLPQTRGLRVYLDWLLEFEFELFYIFRRSMKWIFYILRNLFLDHPIG